MRALLFAALLATAMSAHAGEPLKPLSFRAEARVDVDASGKFVKAEAAKDLPAPVRAYIEQQLATWQYKRKPDARGVASTWVNVMACAVPNAQGAYAMGLAYKGSGPQITYMGGMNEVSYVVAHNRIQGEGKAKLALHADGSATLDSFDGTFGDTAAKTKLEKVVRKWVSTFHVELERIDGQPIATTGVLPIKFTLGGDDDESREELLAKALVSPQCKQAAQLAGGSVPQPNELRLAADSIVAIEPKI